MLSKIVAILLLTATSILADSYSVQDAEDTSNFFHSQNFFYLKALEFKFYNRFMSNIAVGKRAALEKAKSQDAAVVRAEWNDVEKEGLGYLFAERDVINSIRDSALRLAPNEWKQAVQSSIRLTEKFKNACADGNAKLARSIQQEGMNNTLLWEAYLKNVIATRQEEI